MPNTLTSTQVARVVAGTDFPMALPGRLNAITVVFNPGGTSLSTSDVVQFVALPDHARVVDVMFSRNGSQPINFTGSIGDASTTARWMLSQTLSVTTGVLMIRPTTGELTVGHRISLSASNEGVAVETVDLTVVATSACVTGSYQMTVYYLYEPGT